MSNEIGQVQREKPYDGLPRPSKKQRHLFWSGLEAQPTGVWLEGPPTGHHFQNIAINL
ncbi:hypothetical protein RBSWK_01203 [Rhodopirellula baltica SWK14]|uniref:Uncharacterized protein n=1 Tax=Rhodopirellula baltica SWK14 TaxID=993516 RepID=L7CM40_RHOBT|nr:hypothetical protein RBSWK_01203 [Rhodopirellula baltica SWK14]